MPAILAVPVIIIIVGSIAISIGMSLITSLITGALSPNPKSPNIPDFETEANERRATARNSSAAKHLVFGEVRKSGTLNLFESTGTNAEFLHIGVTIAGHRCDQVLDFQINDEELGTQDGDGNVSDGRFANHARAVAHLGLIDQPASPNWLAEIANYSAADQGKAITYLEARLKWNRSVFPNGFKNLTATVRGMLLYDPRETAIAIAETFTGTPGIFRTTIGHGLAVGDQVWIKDYTASVPAVVKEFQIGSVPASDRFTLLGGDGEPLGITTAGSGGTATKMLWSNNWALCVRHWLSLPRWGFGLPDTQIDDIQTIAAANICDEQAAITHQLTEFTVDTADDALVFADGGRFRTGDVCDVSSTGTEPAGLLASTDYFVIRVGRSRIRLATTLDNARARVAIDITDAGSGIHTARRKSQLRYTVNGVVVLGKEPVDVLEDLKRAGAGQVANQGGIYRIFPGAAVSQSGTTTASDLRTAEFQGVARMQREDLFNAVRGKIIDPDQFYEEVDAPLVTNAVYEAQDGGERIFRDLPMPFVDDPLTAKRLFIIANDGTRQALTFTWPAKPSKFNTAIWDVEAITHARLGFAGKQFQAVHTKLNTDWSVDITYREYADVYDPSPDLITQSDPAPNSNLPNPFNIRAPSDLMLESGDATSDVRIDGTVFSRIKASWVAPSDAFVTQGGRIEIQFKKTSDPDSAFQDAPPVPGAQTSTFILDVQDGVAYDVQIRSVNALRVESNYVRANNHVVEGKSEKPARPDQFFVDQLADGTRRYSIVQNAIPNDVRTGGGWRIKYKAGGGGVENDWPTLPSLTEQLITTFPLESNELAAGAYTFLAKTVDSSENESAESAFVDVTLGNPRLANALVDRSERALGWPGVLVDAFVAATGIVFAESSTTIDDLPSTIDALAATISGIGTNKSPISYTTPEIDLGVDLNFRPLVSVQARGTVAITMQTGTSADGSVTGAFGAIGTVTGKRYIKIRVTVTDTDAKIENVGIILDAPTTVEVFENVPTGTETAVWFNSIAAGHFEVGSLGGLAAISQAQITAIQNVGAGYSWELISKAKTVNSQPAAEFKVYDNTNTLADATVDVLLRGPKGE
jgi:hypothetical protein